MLCTIVSVAMVTGLTACGTASTSGNASENDDVIKVALIPPDKGALAAYTANSLDAWNIAVDEINAAGGIDGRKVELIVRYTDGDPATTLREAKAAVTTDGAQFISNVWTSAENAALNAQLPGLGVLSLNAVAADDGLRGEQCSPYAYNILLSSTMELNGAAGSLADLPGKKWAIQIADMAFGHSAAETFKKDLEAAGGEVVWEGSSPLGTTDFGPNLANLKSSGADALFVVEPGADAVTYIKQLNQFGAAGGLKSVLGVNTVGEPLLPALGDSVKGYYMTMGYSATVKNELNDKFVKSYTDRSGAAPYYVPANNYLAAQTLFTAIDKAGSVDRDTVAEVLNDISFDSILGEVTMRPEDHQLMRPSYLGQVDEGPNGLDFKLVAEAGPEQNAPEPNPDCEL